MSVPPGHQDIPLGPLGTLHIDETTDESTADSRVVTQRALWLDSPVLGQIVIAEAIADYEGGDPC